LLAAPPAKFNQPHSLQPWRDIVVNFRPINRPPQGTNEGFRILPAISHLPNNSGDPTLPACRAQARRGDATNVIHAALF